MRHVKTVMFLFAIYGFVLVIPQTKAIETSQASEYTIDFETLGYDTQSLQGSYDTVDIYFGLPADWELSEGVNIQLNTTAIFDGVPVTEIPNLLGGTLEVYFNNKFIESYTINEEGEYSIEVAIPPEALLSDRDDGRYQLQIVLDSNVNCRPDVTTTVLIDNSSFFVLPYEITTPPTDLSLFPYPIYQRSLIPDSALVLVPTESTDAEMQAALSIMAGLGNQTDGKLDITLIAEGELTQEQMQANDLIIVGKIDNSSLIKDLLLPVPLTEAGFTQLGATSKDGIVQILLSPWNDTNVVMVVTGATDEAVVKAGQAISAGNIQPSKRSDVAVITAIEPQLVRTYGYRSEQTFTDLGYKVKTLNGPGSDTTRYLFYIPPGYEKDGESYLDLYFAHSALLNNDLSGLFVRLNKELIGSARFDSENAGRTDVQIPLPNSVMRKGWNELAIEGALFPRDVCSDPQGKQMWLTLYPESTLRLSLKEDATGLGSPFILATYPEPFALEQTMSNVAVILPSNDPAAWQAAGALLFDLGDQAAIPLANFAVAFADAVPEELNETYEWILIGQPIDLPILQTLQDDLPAPFIVNSNQLAKSAFPVAYQVPDGQETGFLELLRAPNNAMRTIVAILGNSDVGVQLAVEKLINAPQYNLNGNFALVTDSQVQVSNTIFDPLTTTELTPIEPLTETVEATDSDAPVESLVVLETASAKPPNWVLSVLTGTVGLIAVISFGVAIYYLIMWLRRRRAA